MPINQKTASHWSTGLTTASILLGIGAGLSSLFTGGASLAAYGAWMGVSEAAAAAASGLTYGGVATGLGASLSGILGSSAALQQHQKGAGGQLGFAIGQGVLSVATMGLSNAVSGTAKMASRALGVVGAAGAAYGVGQEIKGIASGNIQLKGKGHGWERLDVFNAVSGTLGVMAAGGNEILGKIPTPTTPKVKTTCCSVGVMMAQESSFPTPRVVPPDFDNRLYQVLSRGISPLDAPLLHGLPPPMVIFDQQRLMTPVVHIGVRLNRMELNSMDFQETFQMLNDVMPHITQRTSFQIRSILHSTGAQVNGLQNKDFDTVFINPIQSETTQKYSITMLHESIHALLTKTGNYESHGPEFYVAHNDLLERLFNMGYLSSEQISEMAQQNYAFNPNPYTQIDPDWTSTKTRIFVSGNAGQL
jgi:hypothetical protein